MTNNSHQKRRFAALLSIIALLLIGLAIFCVISSGEGKIKIYFYSSETNINNFKSLKMKVLAEGEEALLLIVALPQGFAGNCKKTIEMIKNMPMDSDGKRRIRMLGLDGWQELNSSDRSKLES